MCWNLSREVIEALIQGISALQQSWTQQGEDTAQGGLGKMRPSPGTHSPAAGCWTHSRRCSVPLSLRHYQPKALTDTLGTKEPGAPTHPGLAGLTHLAQEQPTFLQHVALSFRDLQCLAQEDVTVLPVSHQHADIGHQVVQPGVEHSSHGVLRQEAFQVLATKTKTVIGVRRRPWCSRALNPGPTFFYFLF